jgi:hypothetical protein
MAKKRSRALSVRGGFATPPTFRTPGGKVGSRPAYKNPMYGKQIVSGPMWKDPVGKLAATGLTALAGGKTKKVLKTAVDKASKVAIRTGVQATLVIGTNISNGNVDGGKNGVIISAESKKKVNASNRNVTNPALRYTTTLYTGNPTSKSIKRYMQNNGSKELILQDSLKTNRYKNGAFPDREMSVIKAGFNQKIFYVNKDFQTSLEEVSLLYGLTLANGITGLEKFSKQVAYGLASELQEKLSFTSLNSYNAIDLKVHLVASKATKAEAYEPSSTLAMIRHLTGVEASPIFNYNDYIGKNKTIKEVAAYPNFIGSSVNPTAYYCLVDPSITIRSSSSFNQSHEVLHTVSQRLQPGDMLDVKNMIGLGSGVILNDLYTRMKVAESISPPLRPTIPLVYAYVIEASGQRCIGYETSGTMANEPFQGTSPLAISTEHSHKVTLGLQNIQGTNNLPNDEGWLDDRFAVKVFTKDDFASDSVTNVIYNKDYKAAGFEIKTLSDRAVVTATPIVPIP